MESQDSLGLTEAVTLYTSGLKSKDSQTEARQELFRFAQWFSNVKRISDLKPSELEAYSERVLGAGNVPRATERLQEVRKFLAFARKKGLVGQNLAQHLRIRRSKAGAFRKDPGGKRDTVVLSPEGHKELLEEVERLKESRGPLASEIRRAAADKDVRENAPLEAAREELGHVESRILQIESTLAWAVVGNPTKKKGDQAVSVGSVVRLKDVDSGRETKYTVVTAFEANPLSGKISDVSPVGSALMGRWAGQEIQVKSPRGRVRYRILRVSS